MEGFHICVTYVYQAELTTYLIKAAQNTIVSCLKFSRTISICAKIFHAQHLLQAEYF